MVLSPIDIEQKTFDSIFLALEVTRVLLRHFGVRLEHVLRLFLFRDITAFDHSMSLGVIRDRPQLNSHRNRSTT